jgi:adenylosuccinate synthase
LQRSRRSKPYGLAVRNGGPNAGHSVLTPHGSNWAAHVERAASSFDTLALRHVPVAAVSSTTETRLVLPAAALVHLEVLQWEIETLDRLGYEVSGRLYIDPLATVITHEDEEAEKAAGLRGKNGSTLEGVGAAQARKVMRSASVARDVPELQPFLADTFELVWDAVEVGESVQLELTQGMGLSLHWGHYPFATSRDVSPAQAFNDAGLSPGDSRLEVRTHLLARSFPIRVAGNSGPFGMPGSELEADELSWEELGRRTGGYAQPERTTVTKLVRRVAEWDGEVVLRSARWARPRFGVLMFADYLFPHGLQEVARAQGFDTSKLGWSHGVGVSRALEELTRRLWVAGSFERYRLPFRAVGSDLYAVSWGYGAVVPTPAAAVDGGLL